MNCEQVVEHLWQYLDGELDSETSDALAQHLAECRRCFSRTEFERHLKARVRHASEAEGASPGLRERLATLLRLF